MSTLPKYYENVADLFSRQRDQRRSIALGVCLVLTSQALTRTESQKKDETRETVPDVFVLSATFKLTDLNPNSTRSEK